jgi:hypothetical protein
MLYAKPCKALQRILIGIIDGMYYREKFHHLMKKEMGC